MPEITKTIGSLVGGRARNDEEWIAEQTELRFSHAPPWRGYLAQMWSMAGWSALPLLPQIHAPTLVLSGDDDPLNPVVNAMMTAHLLPKARLRIFPGEGHLMVMDEQSEAHPTIRKYLTAPRYDQSAAWRSAATVTADDVRAAMDAVGLQLPPYSLLNSCARHRWLSLNWHGDGK